MLYIHTVTLAEKGRVIAVFSVQRMKVTLRWLSNPLHYVCVCVCVRLSVCVWLEDLTAGKLMIEQLILSDLTPRLAFLFHFILLYIYFFSLSCRRVQHVSLLQALMEVKDTHTNKHRCKLKPTCTSYLPYTHRRCDGSPVCQVIRQRRQSRELPCGLESFQTAGQEARTAAPHAPCLVSPPPTPLPGLTFSFTHCLSPCRTGTLRRARQDER